MKRLILFVLILLLLIGCAESGTNTFRHSRFEAELPDGFERVQGAGILCFAPHGDPQLSSSITFYTTELNWYFDRFTEEDYQTALAEQCGYDELTVLNVQDIKVDGHQAKRIACSVRFDQGIHDLIVYAVNTNQICFFTLLNLESDQYVDDFDAMMKTIRLKENE